MGLGDGLATAHDLPLRDRIDGVDVIETLAGLGVALMHRVDAQIAGPAAWVGPSALADRHRTGTGLGDVQMVPAVARGAPQIVDVGGRDRGQPLILPLAVDPVLALEDMAHRRPGKPFVSGIDGGQQGDIVGAVAARKAMATTGRRGLHGPALAVASDQARDLRQAASADLGQIAAHHALVFLRQPQVLLGLQGALHEAVDLLPTAAGEAEAGAGSDKLAHLAQRETLNILHGDSHSPAVCPLPTAVLSGSSCIGNTPPVQDHLALDNSGSQTSPTPALQ